MKRTSNVGTMFDKAIPHKPKTQETFSKEKGRLTVAIKGDILNRAKNIVVGEGDYTLSQLTEDAMKDKVLELEALRIKDKGKTYPQRERPLQLGKRVS